MNIEGTGFAVCYVGSASKYRVQFKKRAIIAHPFLESPINEDWTIQVEASAGHERRIVKSLSMGAIEKFASCKETPSAVGRFMTIYGPLRSSIDGQSFPDWKTFSGWLQMKYQFQALWDRVLNLNSRKPFGSAFNADYHETVAGMREIFTQWERIYPSPNSRELATNGRASGNFSWTNNKFIFVGDSLYAALQVKLFSLASTGKLRRCPNPVCAIAPYFIADADRRKFCSIPCANEAKRQSKRDWWNKEGNQRRINQSRIDAPSAPTNKRKLSKGKNDGTQKTR